MSKRIEAKCLCGLVRFESAAAPVVQLVCHCSDCRQATGNEYSTLAFFESATVAIQGECAERAFQANSGAATKRLSCKACDTLMFDRSEGFPTLVGVFVERIEAPFVPEPACQLWTNSRVCVATSFANLPAYPENIS